MHNILVSLFAKVQATEIGFIIWTKYRQWKLDTHSKQIVKGDKRDRVRERGSV